jgi:WS/DGAT/MGAT family acyltransferase
MFLRLETPDWPGHFGGLALVEGRVLQDETGRLRLEEIRKRIDRRLGRIPQLRRRLYSPGLTGGGPLWADDRRFDIANHVHETAVKAPGDESELLDAAAGLYERLLNRDRPLWELWFLTGVSDGRIGVLLKIHHSVADGMAAVAIVGSLFDLEAHAPDPPSEGGIAEAVPGAWPLIVDNLTSKTRTLGRLLTKMAHPRRLMRDGALRIRVARETLKTASAPRSSLNQVVGSKRLIRSLRLDLGMIKAVAKAHGAKVNDVILEVWTGGLRQLMLQHGDPTDGVELISDIPVALPGSVYRSAGNELGFRVVPLPVWEPDAECRLDLIAAESRRAKAGQETAATAGFFAAASAMPFAGFFAAHQRSVNTRVSNVMGPPVPVYVLGARVLEILPIMRLFGNVGLTLCAFSYAGRILLVVTADATAFPNLEVLMASMERDWQHLTGKCRTEPIGDATSSIEPAPLVR